MAFTRSSPTISANTTNGSTSLTNVNSTLQIWVGMNVYGTGIQADTIITAISGSGPGATVTISKAATANGTGVGISGQYITQTGTDADPTGLVGLTGVTTTDSGTGIARRLVFNLGTNQLRIQGNLTHDPDLFEIVSGLQYGIIIQSPAVYNYGIARTVNSQVTYSKGTGLVSTYSGGQFTNFGIVFETGTLNWNGGVIKTLGAILHTGTSVFSNSYDSVWQMWNTADTQWRATTGVPAFNAITMQGVGANILLFLNNGWVNLGVKFERCLFQTPGGGGVNRTILNPIFTGNQASADIYTNQTVNAQQIITTKNPDRFPLYGKLQNTAYCDFPVTETLVLNVANSSNAAVGANEVVAYIKDSNNGARLNTGVSNYVNDRSYIAVSNSSGVVSMGDILTMVGVNLNTTSATINYDYRSNFGNNSSDFNIYFGGYLYNPAVTRETLMGNNGVTTKWTMFNDSNVTLTRTNALAKLASSFTVNSTTKVITVTANSTYDVLYDIAKAWKYNGTQTNAETPTISDLVVAASGSELTAATGWTLVVNTGVTLSAGTKFTYVKFDTVTINGTGKITGVYSDTTGTSTVLTLSGFGANSAVYVEDNAGVQKYFNADVTGSVVVYIPPTATGSWYYAIEKFGNQRQSDFFTFSGGQKAIVVKELPDNKILLSKAQITALTSVDNPDEAYDAIALLRTGVPYISFGQIVSKDGSTLYGADYSILIKSNATNVADVDYDNKLITLKSALFEAGPLCNLVKVDVPKTVTANATEVINVNIEDNNGDSTTEIKGVSGSLVDVWKCTNGTLNVDYATGTKIAENIGAGKYRFIHQDGFKLIFFDKDTLMARDCSMSKGTYTLGWYVYNNSQGGLDQNQSDKFETIFSKVDVIDDNVVSVKGTVEGLSASTGVTEAEIIAMGLAKEATSEAIKTKVEAIQTSDTDVLLPTIYAIQNQQNNIAQDQNDILAAIQSANNNFNPVTDSLSAISDAIDVLKTLVEDKTGYSLTTNQVQAIAVAVETHLLDEGDNQMLINAIVGAIGNANIDETVLVAAIRADIERADGMLKAVKTKADTLNNADFTDTNALIVDLGSPLQAADYVAPDNAKIVQIKTKVDTLENADFTTTNGKIDALAEASGETTPATIKAEIKPMLDKLNEGLQTLSNFEPYEDDLPN